MWGAWELAAWPPMEEEGLGEGEALAAKEWEEGEGGEAGGSGLAGSPSAGCAVERESAETGSAETG